MNEKVAVITGTSSGLGLAMATTCLERGFLVFGGSRTESPIVHENFIDLELDIRSEKSVIEFFSEIAKETEVVDVLINNAGICGMNSFAELDS
jgi:NAD(P)-dependent dehydrogenase (short-subunit alcohol dehydrogenase family)